MTYYTINTRYMSMPTTIRSFVRRNSDMSYTIVLNSRFNHETLKKCYKHELHHIHHDDFDKEESVNLIETAAHSKSL